MPSFLKKACSLVVIAALIVRLTFFRPIEVFARGMGDTPLQKNDTPTSTELPTLPWKQDYVQELIIDPSVALVSAISQYNSLIIDSLANVGDVITAGNTNLMGAVGNTVTSTFSTVLNSISSLFTSSPSTPEPTPVPLVKRETPSPLPIKNEPAKELPLPPKASPAFSQPPRPSTAPSPVAYVELGTPAYVPGVTQAELDRKIASLSRDLNDLSSAITVVGGKVSDFQNFPSGRVGDSSVRTIEHVDRNQSGLRITNSSISGSSISGAINATTLTGDGSSLTGVVHDINALSLIQVGSCNSTNDVCRAVAVGFQNTTSGQYASALGYQNCASGQSSSAFGYLNCVDASYGTASGYANFISGGDYSTLVGYRNRTLGTGAVTAFASAFGTCNSVGGYCSTILGSYNCITTGGTKSAAIGIGNCVSAPQSMAIGTNITNDCGGTLQIGISDSNKLCIGSVGAILVGGCYQGDGSGLTGYAPFFCACCADYATNAGSTGCASNANSACSANYATSLSGGTIITSGGDLCGNNSGSICGFTCFYGCVGSANSANSATCAVSLSGGYVNIGCDIVGSGGNIYCFGNICGDHFFGDGSGLSGTSDKNVKQNFVDLDKQDVLSKINSLNIQQWSYKTTPDVNHIGPYAQDFKAAFQLGNSDKSISFIDPAGVALVGVQGVSEKVDTLAATTNAKIGALSLRIDELLASSTSMSAALGGNTLVAALQSIGATVENSIVHFATLFVDTITAKEIIVNHITTEQIDAEKLCLKDKNATLHCFVLDDGSSGVFKLVPAEIQIPSTVIDLTQATPTPSSSSGGVTDSSGSTPTPTPIATETSSPTTSPDSGAVSSPSPTDTGATISQ